MTVRSFAWPASLRCAALPAAALALWWTATHFRWVDARIWATPAEVLRTAWDLAREGYLWKAVGASVLRDLAGLAAGASLGVLAGGILGVSPWAARLAEPALHFLKQVALFAWIPLITLVFGIGEPSKAAFIALAAFYPVALNTLQGIRTVPAGLAEVARLHGLSPRQRLVKVVIPWALPSFLAGLQTALVLAWVATVGVEYFLSAGSSIGGILIQGAETLRLDLVLIGIILLGGIGWTLNRLAGAAGAWLLRNRPKTFQA